MNKLTSSRASKMEKSWDVVVWCAENLIDYVPSSWGNETKTKYKYPTLANSFRIRKLIDTCSPLDKNFAWLETLCKAEAVKDLNMVKDLCEKGQYTSTLETADEQTATGSKRIPKKKKRVYESSDNSTPSEESSDETLSNLLNSKKKTKINEQIGASNGGGLLREKFSVESNKECNNDSLSAAVILSSGSNLPSANKISNSTPIQATPRTTEHYYTPNNKGRVSSGRNNRGNSSLNSERAENNNGLAFCDDLTTIASEICSIKFEIQEIRKVVDRLENIICTNAIATNSNLNEGTTNMFMKKLPCNTTTEIDDLEAEMANMENFRNLVSFFHLLGGNTAHKAVYFMMNKLFSKQLALKYSGKGKKKKIPFCGLKLYDAIIVATRKRHPSATDDGMKKSVALFLATAKSRLPKDGPERNNDRDQEEYI